MTQSGILTGLTILFVDDRYDITRLYIERCKSSGANVRYVHRLEEAFVALDEQQFDVAILDLHMPPPESPYEEKYEASIRFFVDNPHQEIQQYNLGQMVGHYISNRLEGQPPYLYLSAVSAFFRSIPEAGSEEVVCLDRNNQTPLELVQAIAELLGR